MLYEHEGRRPVVDPTAWVAPSAVLVGDVVVGPGCRVLHQAVLTDDGGRIVLGADVTVMEHALVRARDGHDVRVGDAALIGPHAHVNGATVGETAFLATGTSVFPGAQVGAGAEVRINAVVHVNSRLPAGQVVPIGWVAVGDPAQVFAPGQHDAIWEVQRELDFPGTLWGLARDDTGATSPGDLQRAVAMRYRDLFGRHRADRPV